MEYKNRYGIYFRLAALDSLEYQNIILDRKNRNKIENATIDEVQVTNDQHGLVHNLREIRQVGLLGDIITGMLMAREMEKAGLAMT